MLKDYYDDGFEDEATLFLVHRLPGGGASNTTVQYQLLKCMICLEDKVTKRMPCSHSVCPECIFKHSWNEAHEKRNIEIVCPERGCGNVWKMSSILEQGNIQGEQRQKLQSQLSKNVILKDIELNECPGCGSYCERKNKSRNRVSCSECSSKGTTTDFCWNCLHTWKNQDSTIDCGNKACHNELALKALNEAPLISIQYQLSSLKCPSKRACVTCGNVIELKEGCKHMLCKCQTEFCFICLGRRKGDIWPCGSYKTECTLAPVQRIIPHN